MYFLLAAFIFFYVRKIRKDPKASLTYEHDLRIRSGARFGETPELSGGKKIKRIYLVLLLGSLFLIFLCSFTVLSGVTVVILTVYFLVFGLLAGWLSGGIVLQLAAVVAIVLGRRSISRAARNLAQFEG